MKQNGVLGMDEHRDRANELRATGATVILVAVDKELAGLLAITDPIKQSTPDAVARLHELGLKIAMLTGDNEITAKSVAEQLNIDEVRAGG